MGYRLGTPGYEKGTVDSSGGRYELGKEYARKVPVNYSPLGEGIYSKKGNLPYDPPSRMSSEGLKDIVTAQPLMNRSGGELSLN